MGGGLREKYLLPCCCIRDSLQFDMQDDHVLKKLNFNRLIPRVVNGEGGSKIPFNLICKMAMF